VSRIEHRYISRAEQARPFNAISVLSLGGSDDNVVAAPDPLQLAEMCIPMTSDPDISGVARQTCALDVADTLVQRSVIRALQ
jgi:hypothetical protein